MTALPSPLGLRADISSFYQTDISWQYWLTYHSWPASKIAFFDHQVRALPVVQCSSSTVRDPWRCDCNTVKGPVPLDAVHNLLTWCGPQGLLISTTYCLYRAGKKRGIPCEQSCVKGTVMVIFAANAVQSVDRVRPNEMLLAKVWSSIRDLLLTLQDVERSMRFITRKARREGRTSCPASDSRCCG